MSEENTGQRDILAFVGKDGLEARAQLTSRERDKTVNMYVGYRPIIPVVFLPGIMGSNIYNTKLKKAVWEPDSVGDLLVMYAMATPKKRQEYLDQTGTIVKEDGPIEDTVSQEYWEREDQAGNANAHHHFVESEKTLLDRGWGMVGGSLYHGFMDFARTELNNIFYKGNLRSFWEKILALPQKEHGQSKGFGRLSAEELKTVAKCHFEFWACGYNWLRSNKESGDAVKAFITDRVLPHYQNKPGVKLATKNKVIIVTHSMGGLVARSLVVNGGRDLVLGVVHGAMPANGAGEAYTNVRKGIGGSLGIVVGTDAANVGAVFSQCQGGLELLPFGVDGSIYNPRPESCRLSQPRNTAPVPASWLFWRTTKDAPAQKCGPEIDIYKRIYKSREWYGLLPEQNEHHFDPAEILKKISPKEKPIKIFDRFIDDAKMFHKRIAGKYHSQTYAFWGASPKIAATGEALWEARGEAWWEKDTRDRITDRMAFRAMSKGTTKYDSGKGQYVEPSADLYHNLNIIEHYGDGTVPRASWENDLNNPALQGYCCPGSNPTCEKSFGHQEAFNYQPAREACLYFIAKLVSDHAKELQL